MYLYWVVLFFQRATLVPSFVIPDAATVSKRHSSSPSSVSCVFPDDGAPLSDDSVSWNLFETNHLDIPSDFYRLAERIVVALRESDQKRSTGFDGASTGWTSWVDEPSANALQQHLSTLSWAAAAPSSHDAKFRSWMLRSPQPLLVEWTDHLLAAIQNTTVYQYTLSDETKTSLLHRIGFRLILLPSDASLRQPPASVPGSMIFGLLLHGGVTRYRLIGNHQSNMKNRSSRKVGMRTSILVNHTVDDPNNEVSWLQYGGPDRNYHAVDMGPCLLLELILLPTGFQYSPLSSQNSIDGGTSGDMILSSVILRPEDCLQVRPISPAPIEIANATAPVVCLDHSVPLQLESTLCSVIGGLDSQIHEIVRRVLDGRIVTPEQFENHESNDTVVNGSNTARNELQLLRDLGLHPVRGLLLYGPPGCGKTYLAREISYMLNLRTTTKIIAAPELLDRWVGGTERLVRDLFADAERELQLCNGDATKSALHVIIIDEIDAVFRKRSSSDSSSEVTRASAVNQILSKLDGIRAMDNVLLIGLTNRRELLDPALLRPGRLEVQIKIGLPNAKGRREILQIHFSKLRKYGRLSEALCNAIDGKDLPINPKRRQIKRIRNWFSAGQAIRDLAADKWTGGFSGADLAGLVRNSGSFALTRARDEGDSAVSNVLITLKDVESALVEMKKA